MPKTPGWTRFESNDMNIFQFYQNISSFLQYENYDNV